MSTVPRQTLTIPDKMIPYLSDQLNLDNVIRCPMIVCKDSHHLHFHTPRICVPEMHPFGPIPPSDTPCWLILLCKLEPAEYQESRVIVLVQHIQSPAILSLAVPYKYFVGDTSSWWAQVVWNVVSRVKILRKPDNEDYLPGEPHCVSLDPITNDWEINDEVQATYSPV
ncbi:hypothetical protein BD309DRAFT_874448 [Dichomitus squalens]|uniref:Uncharacterized protein n=1 Tax=Dichomitus squalens TaxID=114155 RepID=A0A4Q9PXV4_9APHY|nr:hypothetical protein BD309DRAFT_874448 [Dichomitus squalens]TBU59582.1 hypothetical protein BD310DRAFT_816971 [Dichomitus squalens]